MLTKERTTDFLAHAAVTIERNEVQTGLRPLAWWSALAFSCIIGFARFSYGLLIPTIQDSLHGSYSMLGLIGTANFAGYLLGTLGLPFLLMMFRDRIKMNCISLFLMNATILASASSTDFLQLGIWRFLVGFFSAVANPLTLSLLLERTPPAKQSDATGFIWIGSTFGIVITGLIAPPVLQLGSGFSWRLMWAIMGLLGLICTYGLYRSLQANRHRQLEASSSAQAHISPLVLLLEVLSPRKLLFLMLSMFSYGCGYIIFTTYFISLVVQQGLPSILTGIVWGAMGIFGILGGLVWIKSLQRWPNGFLMGISMLIGTVGTLISAASHVFAIGIGAALAGAALFIGPPLISTVVQRNAVDPDHFTGSLSFMLAIFGIGQLIGPTLGGAIVDTYGLRAGIVVGALILGCGALSSFLHGVIEHRRR
ncbi:putative MFS family arabinose efflux permease [Thermosporothrix hazakensis]|jgi:predicted MFS family arabinose efflux permease|uniref:Major facilitator superfamily (MFS) profile domain-containing protein n=2 Tax=Thermosporothrix TaxID=768650 RepID=A0A455SYH4_9CHLR|nr:YbfB/YjiJ family MFS transporter [Thermosporothrix hazakensis]PZW30449.1 putative MFS family arabinose efflux permease [Thermosporothrix hazakensis]BBH91165.1 hypothetical protein KTC_59160 [Thermosporothrix sp. COM3]GCE49310.1 hypothetical protein KTH_41790 [Thermosporothrix hazakensis]